jgi:hypothetical protein
MTHGLKVDIPAGQGQPQPETKINAERVLDRARMRALTAEPVVPLNVELHQLLSRLGGAKASTLTSAMASLVRLRKTLADQ